MTHYRTVLFDIDDTLIDFKESERLSLENIYTQFFSAIVEKEVFLNDYRRINHALWKQVEEGAISSSVVGSVRFQQLAGLYKTPFSSAIPSNYERSLVENSQWILGAKDLLGALKTRQIQIGFISNGFAHMQRDKYKELALSDYSEVLVISEEVGWAKPDPRIFHHTLGLLNAKCAETLMVGDSLSSDGEGARGVGIPFCWYNPSRAAPPQSWHPDHILHNLTWDELSPLFSKETI